MSEIADSANVGVGTLYRHFPTRERLLAALSHRSFDLVLAHARSAASDERPAIESIGRFFEQTIKRREELVMPLHGGPVMLDGETRALQRQIRVVLGQVLARGREDGTILMDATPEDIIIAGAVLAQPLPHVQDWNRVARRLARVFLAGLGTAAGRRSQPG